MSEDINLSKSVSEQRRKLRLGELMVQQGLISQDQLRIALM